MAQTPDERPTGGPKEGQGRPATREMGQKTRHINDRSLDQQERSEQQVQAEYRRGTDLDTSPVTVNQGEAEPEDPDLKERQARRAEGEGENASRKEHGQDNP